MAEFVTGPGFDDAFFGAVLVCRSLSAEPRRLTSVEGLFVPRDKVMGSELAALVKSASSSERRRFGSLRGESLGGGIAAVVPASDSPWDHAVFAVDLASDFSDMLWPVSMRKAGAETEGVFVDVGFARKREAVPFDECMALVQGALMECSLGGGAPGGNEGEQCLRGANRGP